MGVRGGGTKGANLTGRFGISTSHVVSLFPGLFHMFGGGGAEGKKQNTRNPSHYNSIGPPPPPRSICARKQCFSFRGVGEHICLYAK